MLAILAAAWMAGRRVVSGWSTPLGEAIMARDVEAVREAITSGLDVKTLGLKTPILTMAVMSGQPEILRLLLKAGVSPNGIDADSAPPLMLAAVVDSGLKRTDMTAILLEHGSDPNLKDAGGRSVLDNVVQGQAAPLADLLIRHGALCAVEPQQEATHLAQLYRDRSNRR